MPAWTRAWPLGLLLVTVFLGGDLAADIRSGLSLTHIALDAVAFAVAVAGLTGTAMHLRANRRGGARSGARSRT